MRKTLITIALLFLLQWDHSDVFQVDHFNVYHRRNLLKGWKKIAEVKSPDTWLNLTATRTKSGFVCVSAVNENGTESEKSSLVLYLKGLGQYK